MWTCASCRRRRRVGSTASNRRRRVIGLRQAGLAYEAIAAQVGLSATGVFDICKRFAARGAAGLKTGPRGPAPGTGRTLDAEQEAEAQSLIRRHTPDERGLPFDLWSRAAVRELIWQRCRVRLAVRTMGTYLARWGFTPSAAIPSASLMEPSAAPPRSRCGAPTSKIRPRCGAGCG